MKIHAVRSVFSSLALAVVAAVTPLVALADDSSLEELLIEKGFITEDELAEARREAEPTEDTTEAEAPAAQPDAESKLRVTADKKGLRVESADGEFEFAFGGRLQWDFGGFTGGATRLGDGTELRRGRIKSYGTVWRSWDFKLEVNFDPNGEVSVTDGWIRYSGWKPFTVTAGHQKVPFSQQSMTSSNWQVFQERALLDAFIDTPEEGRRRVGVVLQSYGDHWNIAGGVFGEGIATAGNGNNEDWGTAGRVVIAPIAGETRLVAVGGSVYYREFESVSGLRYSNRPEAHLADFRLVDTGVLGTSRDDLMYNFEGSVVFGPFHAQGEYTGARVRRSGADANLMFDGWYAQAGWFLTGESRNYDMKSAQYKGITPKRRIGAWELAARYSKIDLEDVLVRGGRESNVTAGLNWWVNYNIMIRFNYVRAWLEPNSAGLQTSPPPGPFVLGGIHETVNAFMGRIQIVF